MSRAKITSKGQVTIPLDIRRSLGAEAGDYVAFEVQADYVVMRRQKSVREVSSDLRERAGRATRRPVADNESVESAVAEDLASEDHSAGLKLVYAKQERN